MAGGAAELDDVVPGVVTLFLVIEGAGLDTEALNINALECNLVGIEGEDLGQQQRSAVTLAAGDVTGEEQDGGGDAVMADAAHALDEWVWIGENVAAMDAVVVEEVALFVVELIAEAEIVLGEAGEEAGEEMSGTKEMDTIAEMGADAL